MIFSKLWGYVLTGFTLIAGFFSFFLYAKRQGKKEEQNAEALKSLEQAKEANEIDTKVHSLSDADLDKQLHDVQRKK